MQTSDELMIDCVGLHTAQTSDQLVIVYVYTLRKPLMSL